MAQKKLVSVRLDEEDLQTIDKWAEGFSYRKRSDMINAAIRFAAWAIQNGYAEKIVQFEPRHDEVDIFILKYHWAHL